MKQLLSLVCVFFVLVSIISCRKEPPPEDRLKELALAFRTLDCRQATLEIATLQTWDSVVTQLDARLPEDMPATEKHNMLTVRNAGLIRMFETYRELPDSVQALVSLAEQKDKDIVAALNAIKLERAALDKKKRAFFREVEKRASNQLPSLRRHFDALKNTPCQ